MNLRSPAVSHLLEYCDSLSDDAVPGGNTLLFLEELDETGARLQNLCLKAIGIARKAPLDHYTESSLVAAEILGRRFSGKTSLIGDLLTLLQPAKNSIWPPALSALCWGWPEREELEALHEYFRASGDGAYTLTSSLSVWATKSTSDKVAAFLVDMPVLPDVGRSWEWRRGTRLLVRRLARDDAAYDCIVDSLAKISDSSAIGSVARVLAESRGLEPRVRRWCHEEVNRELCGAVPPRVGLDIVSGYVRPLAYSLMDALEIRS